MSILLLIWLFGFFLMIFYDIFGARTWAARTAWNDARYAVGAVAWPVFAVWELAKERC